MITLESPRWSELTHAYGAADDVSSMLTKLSSGDDSSIDELFGALYHQGTVYDASYATVPYLVEIASRTNQPNLRAQILTLAGFIVVSSDYRSVAPIASDVRVSYEAALPRARDLALATLEEPIDPLSAVYLLQALAGLDGHTILAHCLAGFVDKEFLLECPSCASELFVWPDVEGLVTAAEDPVAVPTTTRTAIIPGPTPGSTHDADFRWLMHAGGKAALSVIARRLPYLFGIGTCPACNATFSVMDELSNFLE